MRRQRAALRLFGEYLAEASPSPGNVAEEVEAWRGLSWGIIAGFRQWLLGRGYSIGSVNVRLSTVRTYATLASQAGVIAPEQLLLIKSVRDYSRRIASNVPALYQFSPSLPPRSLLS